MGTNPVETFERESYGLSYQQPYPFGIPEELPRSVFSQALSASFIPFTGQGRLLGFTVSSTRASGQFIQVFDANVLPASGAVPPLVFDIATVSTRMVAFDPYGRWFEIGCVIVNSTTQATFTAGSADCLFDVQYVPQVI